MYSQNETGRASQVAFFEASVNAFSKRVGVLDMTEQQDVALGHLQDGLIDDCLLLRCLCGLRRADL